MSVRVMIIPEDFRNDQYILKPVFSRLLRDMGRGSAKVVVCQEPRLGGLGEALKFDRLEGIVEMWEGVIDLFILCVDRDGDENRRARLDHLEARFERRAVLLAENAWEELETWLLAGVPLLPGWRWSSVRAEIDVKETYFEPLAQARNLARHPGGGRGVLGKEAARRIGTIRMKCPEDFDALARRVETFLSASSLD